ncbi:hypothetical protein Sjap_021862 [Stephania japonica]|uniref:Uncharacterized protein n=1 Tax=Stephania japonica TaxID=461633 RepID=A0AAP0EQD5_9MAGN
MWIQWLHSWEMWEKTRENEEFWRGLELEIENAQKFVTRRIGTEVCKGTPGAIYCPFILINQSLLGSTIPLELVAQSILNQPVE